MREFLAICKALSDEHRVRAAAALAGGELCVCQVIELLELAPSTVSKHMAVLQQAGLVDSRKEGRWVYYRRPGRGAPAAVREAIRWLDRHLAEDAAVRRDAARLRRIRRTDPEKLCTHYRRGGAR